MSGPGTGARWKRFATSSAARKATRAATSPSSTPSRNPPILCEQLDPSIFIVGTAFEEQSLLSKQVDVIFSNPPYSVFPDWTNKLLREAAAPLVYLVIPDRWEQNQVIAEALRYRNATPQIVGHFDFESADRSARAHVHLLRIELATDKDDAFERFFDEEFGDLRARFHYDKEKAADDREREDEDEKAERERRGKFGHLVVGATYPEAMVALYNEEMAKIRRNYDAVKLLDVDLMRELGITPSKIMEGLRQRLEGLRNEYWQEIFNRLSAITDRLTTKNRRLLLETLNKHCHVDFTVGNIHAVVLWAIKNANNYLDSQLLETFEKMVDKANVRNYASNKRPFVEDRWRYNQDKTQCSHYCLEYRLVLQWIGGIQCGYSWERGLSESACEFLMDLLTVARNLGFQCNTADDRLLGGRSEWTSGTKVEFHRTNRAYEVGDRVANGTISAKVKLADNHWQYKVGKEWLHERCLPGELLFEVRAFKNRNIHMRLNQKFALAFNVEYGRLKGWLNSGEEAARETGDPEAAALFRTHLYLPTIGGTSALMLGAPMEGDAPSSPTPEPVMQHVRITTPSGATGTCDTNDVAALADLQADGATVEILGPSEAAAPGTSGGRCLSGEHVTIVDDSSAAPPLGNTQQPTNDTDTMKRFDPLKGCTTDVNTPAPAPATKPKPAAKKRSEKVPETGDFKQAATLLHAHTGHTGDFWRLMGPSHKATRQQIMTALMGRKIPQDECGLTVLRDLFHQHVGVSAWEITCDADRDAKFAVWLRDFLAGKAPAKNAPTPVRPADYADEPKHGGRPSDTPPAHVTVTQPAAFTSPVALAAMRVPLATFVVLTPGLTTDDAEAHRFAFAFWCEQHAESFSDWRKAHLAYLHPKAPLTEEHLRGYPADEAPADSITIVGPHGESATIPMKHEGSFEVEIDGEKKTVQVFGEAQPRKIIPFEQPEEQPDPVLAALAALR